MPVELKLLIDKDKMKVVIAESDKHFVDTIFSFLTANIGNVVRLSGKKCNLGCMDALYESVENLDSQYFQTKAGQDMLLHPRSASEGRTKDLAVNIVAEHPKYYTSTWKCATSTCGCRLICSVKNYQCLCGSVMTKELKSKTAYVKPDDEGVFLEGNMRFMIADDLSVGLFSTTTYLSRLSKLGVSNWTNLDVKSVNVSTEEAFHLLKRSLVSKTPLTDVFLPKVGAYEDVVIINPTSEDGATEVKEGSRKMRVKLVLSKSKNKLLYAEANADFVDLLFSFLTFPLGSIVKLLGPGSSIHCLDNLYKSVEDLSSDDSCIISKECSAMLLDPKLALHWQCENQLLPVMEEGPEETLHSINPKIKGGTAECGGGFVNGPKTTFMVTDGLDVKPMNLVLGISILESFNIPFSDLQESVASVGEKEALSLLRASLSSKTVLTDVFCRQKLQQSEIKLECNYPYRS